MLHMMYIFCKSFQWYVASILKKMFHLFLTYVAASVLSGCCIRFTHVASVLSRCSIRFTHMLQVFYLDIAYVFTHVLQAFYLDVEYVSHIRCNSMFQMFLSVSDVCCI
jgi:hypothetical protein